MIPASELFTRYSTMVVTVLMGLVAYWFQLDPAEQARLITEYPWLKHAAPIGGLVSFLVARAVPQEPKQ